ncbi:MAG: 1-(5-phosphoribosyl)-5-[(5-phosphoribosylamino)methylideneamino] imidazole-4-carboxamide isomerase [Gemmatimonadetes bacterium]|nr:1-(5-phosphoribosyl)-5-[(5-phosphoribosylamino)methylideneamino] imidazole-4-carboxamide isomerase [Gemmatimonadota bacterium]
MLAIPAIVLREGHVVQLVGGLLDAAQVRLDDPQRVARDWTAQGFTRLHVVDLDADTGAGSNREVVNTLLGDLAIPVQAGGGVRTDADVATLFAAGADRVVLGSRAIDDSAWLARVAFANPDRVIVAADVRGRQVVTRGWSATTVREVTELVAEWEGLPLAAVLVTAVQLQGRMRGADLPLMQAVVRTSPFPVIAAGGVSSLSDMYALAECGVSAVVIGTALYTGAIAAAALAEEFAQ